MNMENIADRANTTRRKLRYQTIDTILNEFDGEIMGLNREMRAEKYRKMAESPFRFYRGSAYLFYFDVTKIPFSFHTPEDKPIWIQGDLHIENFGAFQNEKGDFVYDVNDFDEGTMGSYLYDVLRMSVSIALFCQAEGYDDQEQEERIRTYLNAYCQQMKRFAKGKDDPVTLYFTADNTKNPVRKLLKKLKKRRMNKLLDDFTEMNVDGIRRFKWSEEILSADEAERVMIQNVWEDYIRTLDEADQKDLAFYHIKDIARKQGSGTASIGLDRFYVLIEGEKGEQDLDDLVLEVKEVRAPIPGFFLPAGNDFWEEHFHQGERVIATQKAMHHHEDPFLGYVTMDGRHFYIRERSPVKKKLKAKHIEGPQAMDEALDTMGKITAKIHARADADLEDSFICHHSEIEIAKAIGPDTGRFTDQLSFAAMTYKRRVNADYALFCEWVNSF
ncbi:DUF2252 domain-containing protein [Metabacillus sp. KIGAM252]|uniref:DUF2252 domain-containing protein n=2 Tax=Metabacillus flavus TaxID=2823519 RepID=A0ABS5LK49_9BACI|nr:DUF2252 family protein [Metabacillus flavus]MBS2970986.1 DUF2252 domain-containing protein [Metabacillus flavus]